MPVSWSQDPPYKINFKGIHTNIFLQINPINFRKQILPQSPQFRENQKEYASVVQSSWPPSIFQFPGKFRELLSWKRRVCWIWFSYLNFSGWVDFFVTKQNIWFFFLLTMAPFRSKDAVVQLIPSIRSLLPSVRCLALVEEISRNYKIILCVTMRLHETILLIGIDWRWKKSHMLKLWEAGVGATAGTSLAHDRPLSMLGSFIFLKHSSHKKNR